MTERDTSQGYNQYLAINELTEAQNKLKESEDEFRRILSEIPLSMSVISLEGQVLLVNKKTLDVFDVKQGDMYGVVNLKLPTKLDENEINVLKSLKGKGNFK